MTSKRRGAARWMPWRRRVAAALLPMAVSTPAHAQGERQLFDGTSLAGWEVTNFYPAGPVTLGDGEVVLGRGAPMTGITWKGEFPRTGYELDLRASRLEGSDFFSAITFPVGDDHCTLVIGGWGGSVVGLSSIEGADASENETSRWMSFENGRWYHIRLRVTDERIQAWIDGEPVVDFGHRGRLLSTRIEVLPSRPFGIATWRTAAALRDIRLRMLPGGGVSDDHSHGRGSGGASVTAARPRLPGAARAAVAPGSAVRFTSRGGAS